jgi:hypothetical protein
MIKNGLNKIYPNRHDYSIVHTFGTTIDPQGLPYSFSIYDGRPIPNQNDFDGRFTPALRPLPMGCTGEATTFMAGLEDGALYPPDDFYFATPPGTDGQGRDIRTALSTAKNRGFKLPDGTIGARKGDYYNCYGAGAIDDFDAARIGLWVNQNEKRAVTVGSWWYPEFNVPQAGGILPTPSFNTNTATLHNWLIVGWEGDYLQVIPWEGMAYAMVGIVKMSRTLYNALMAQPWTGAFTQAKTPATGPIPVGYQAIIDHLIYFIRNLFHV